MGPAVARRNLRRPGRSRGRSFGGAVQPAAAAEKPQ